MDKKIKEQKLRDFANSVFDYPEYKEELQFLLTNLNLTKELNFCGYGQIAC